MSELKIHTIALSIAIFGPLINFLIKPLYYFEVNPYLYWSITLGIYIALLILFKVRSFLTLIRLIVLGILVEDFFSAFWSSIILGKKFLPFGNWYTQYFFIGSLGEPTPYILVPKIYLIAILIYFALTAFQYRKFIKSKISGK